MDEAYLHFIYCQDKEWVHRETSHKPRSRCARVWMDEGMITPLLCDPSLLYYIYIYIYIFGHSNPLYSSLFFLGHAS
jgi:hypothetical protein